MSGIPRTSFKRFPAERRRACVPVTRARPRGTRGSLPGRAVAGKSGIGAASEREALLPVDFIIKRNKGVVEK
jgi:hypothetical protein